MKAKILNSPSARFSFPRPPTPVPVDDERSATRSRPVFATARRFALPLGQLWDPTLLDRLQMPLSRFHD